MIVVDGEDASIPLAASWVHRNRGQTTLQLHRERLSDDTKLGIRASEWLEVDGIPPNITGSALETMHIAISRKLPGTKTSS